MTSREFPNNYEDYDGRTIVDSQSHKIDSHYEARLKAAIDNLLRSLYAGLKTDTDWGDYSVYTGTAGIALLHLHLYEILDGGQRDLFLRQALDYIEEPLRHLKRKRATFLCGDAGPLAIGAVIYHLMGRTKDSQKCLKRLHSRVEEASGDETLPDELLYGRVGILYSLLFVQRRLGKDAVDSQLMQKIYKQVVDSGRSLVVEENSRCPLWYRWHDRAYLGAAHGLVGILHTLMTVEDANKKQLDELVAPSIEFMMTLKFSSDNYPSSLESESGDKLVHWCHGAPGWLYMFLKAYQVFGDPKYLDAAIGCGEVVWRRGILRKGEGLCHGTAGNGFGFLALYGITNDPKYLYRACKFAEWCFDYGKHGCRTPDRPLSLFEGLAGTIYFLVSLLDPKNARFPAFQL